MKSQEFSGAVAYAASKAAEEVGAKWIVVFTRSGYGRPYFEVQAKNPYHSLLTGAKSCQADVYVLGRYSISRTALHQYR
jgi:hypothetical protein